MSKRPPPFYGETEFEVEVSDMLEHIGNLSGHDIREAIKTLQGSLEDQTPTVDKSDARKVAELPSLERDAFLADLHREILLVKGWWP